MGYRMKATALVPETSASESHLPALIVSAGTPATLRFLGVFTLNILNKNRRCRSTP
jgi:hypothetical protein